MVTLKSGRGEGDFADGIKISSETTFWGCVGIKAREGRSAHVSSRNSRMKRGFWNFRYLWAHSRKSQLGVDGKYIELVLVYKPRAVFKHRPSTWSPTALVITPPPSHQRSSLRRRSCFSRSPWPLRRMWTAGQFANVRVTSCASANRW